MKFLVYSKDLSGIPIASKLASEDVSVIFFSEDKNARELVGRDVINEGTFGRAISYISEPEDVVLFAGSGLGRVADGLKKAKYNVLFGSSFCDSLEFNRDHALQVADKAGIDLSDGTAGVDTVCSAWFHEGKLLTPILGKFFEGVVTVKEMSFPTKISTSIAFDYAEKCPRIYGQTIKKLLILFEAVKFTGFVDLFAAIHKEEERAKFITFNTSIATIPSLALLNLLEIPWSEFFLMLLSNKPIPELPIKRNSFSCSLSISILNNYNIVYNNYIANNINDCYNKCAESIGEPHRNLSKTLEGYEWMKAHKFILEKKFKFNLVEPSNDRENSVA